MNFGKLIKQLREGKSDLSSKRPLSQRELCAIIGITQASLCNIENEKRSPSMNTLLQIADHYGLKLVFQPKRPRQQN